MLISSHSENSDFFILPGFSKMGKSLAGYSQSMQFCKAVGARLSYYVINSQITITLKDCIRSCVRDPDCESLNYQTSSGICESNNFASVFETGLSSDFIHMTRLAPCWLILQMKDNIAGCFVVWDKHWSALNLMYLWMIITITIIINIKFVGHINYAPDDTVCNTALIVSSILAD